MFQRSSLKSNPPRDDGYIVNMREPKKWWNSEENSPHFSNSPWASPDQAGDIPGVSTNAGAQHYPLLVGSVSLQIPDMLAAGGIGIVS